MTASNPDHLAGADKISASSLECRPAFGAHESTLAAIRRRTQAVSGDNRFDPVASYSPDKGQFVE